MCAVSEMRFGLMIVAASWFAVDDLQLLEAPRAGQWQGKCRVITRGLGGRQAGTPRDLLMWWTDFLKNSLLFNIFYSVGHVRIISGDDFGF
jgi:hypothetical protein